MILGCLVWCCLCVLGYGDGAGTPAQARPTFGAIRWDGWFQDNPWQRNLDPKEWHGRLPFYGRVISENRVAVCGDSQEVMDREIAYAWNESDEGGWLVPTHREGTARLDAVRDALRGKENEPK